jgi:para-nitrobenzyl esterase
MPIVETLSGKLLGERRGEVVRFKGIPFATPPVGERRFASPEPAESWQGVRDATRFSAVAPQLGTEAGAIGKLFRIVRGGVSEDCLYLNVWTPGLDGSDRPVLVWIHGGAFLLGAGSTFIYEGSSLARRGAVVVTFNYRLGAFGFLDLNQLAPGSAPPANLGIRDQLAALEWVRENIHAFGGDPNNVTLFGESAGGMSAGVHLGLEGGSRIFRRAILQSGAAANVSTADEAAFVSRRFLEELEVPPTDWRRLLELPMETLLAAQRAALRGERSRMGSLPWQPSIDGDLIRKAPLEAVGQGAASDVDLLIGTTRDEWKLFGLGERAVRRMDSEELRARVARVLRSRGGDPEAADELIELHRADRGRRRAYETWVSLRTEEVFGLPAVELAEAQARHRAATYVYRFDQPAPRMPQLLGACHGIDLGIVFGTFRHPLLRPVYGASSRLRELSSTVQACWLAFARSGQPQLGDGLGWQPYEEGQRQTMSLGPEPGMFGGPNSSSRRFWPR